MKKLFLILALTCAAFGQGATAGGTGSMGGTSDVQASGPVTLNSITVIAAQTSQNVGSNLGFRATGTLSSGPVVDLTKYATWSSSNPVIANPLVMLPSDSVQNVACLSPGTVQIIATYGGVTGSTSLTCVPVLPPVPTPSSLAISPTNPTIPQGQAGGVQYRAIETYSDGSTQDVTASATWSTSDATKVAKAALTTTQEFDCVGTGSATVTAQNDSLSANTTQTCSAVLSSISVTPATPSVVAGSTFQFIATCTFSDGSSLPCASPTWSSNTTATATINSTGLATAVAAGTTTIKAQLGATFGTTVMTVTAQGPPPPTLSSLAVAPTGKTVNVGQSITLTATGTFSDGSTQNLTAVSTWSSSNTAVATLQLPDGVVGQSYNQTLTGTGSTPYTWTVPALASSGQVDLLDWWGMPLPDRYNFHMSGGSLKYTHVDAGLLWSIKGANGNPWDGLPYDTQFIYDGFTEDGDAADQAACQAAGYSSCFVDPYAFKRFVTPVSAMPRYFTLGGPDVVLNHPSPNYFTRTTNCGADNQPLINLGNMVEITHDGDYFAGTSTRAFGGSVGTQHTVERLHFWGLKSVTPPYTSGHVEVYDLVLGFGQVEWRDYHWDTTTLQYVLGQDSLNPNKVSGGGSAPNFPCKVPNPVVSGGLPPGTPLASSPSLNLKDNTGVISGVPNTPGTFNFTVQQEDGGGAFHLQPQTIIVNATATTATQTVKCVGAGTATITASDGISGNTTVTCQVPVPTLSSIAVAPASPVQFNGSSVQFTANGTYSDGSTQNLTSQVTWTSATPSVATISANVATCVANSGTSVITATLGAVSGNQTLTCQAVTTGTAENSYCTTSGTWIGPTVDGIATLPTHCVYTAVSGSPSPGSTVNVAAGDATALQNALNAATCGQTIVLQAGSTYTGSFIFPNHSCSSANWITVRTSGIASLPAEGVRATPCYANVQLTNRPPSPGPGSCPSMVSAMAKLKGSGALDETIRFTPGADHYRLIGLEVECKTVVRTAQTQNIINIQNSPATTNHLIFDRMWIHGIADRATVRAALMGDGASYIALVNSSVTDIHCLTNVCTDSQIFQGGLGTQAKTAFKGYNNYVESSGTNSMSFGGGGATVMPTDWEWRNNEQYKPWSWNPACVAPLPVSCTLPNGTPVTYDGLGPYPVKNMLEVKNIIRALIEGNVMENNWMFADQNASAILFTPKNQSGNQCPLCTLRDLTVRYNRIISSGGFLQAVNATADDGGLATEGSHYSIHDNLAENLNFQGVVNTGHSFTTYGIQTWSITTLPCGSTFVQHDVQIFHNTLVIAAGRNYNAMHQMDGPIGPCEAGMVFRDNLAFYGTQGVNQISNTACAQATSIQFAGKYTRCWTAPFVMTGNAIISGIGTWPAGNLFPANATAVGWVNYNNGRFGDYTLTASSPLHNAATDGKDIGADINALNQKIAGVR